MLRQLQPERVLRQERASPIDRAALMAWYRRNRERSRALFDLLIDESAYYSQPIALRHPFVFYEGHVPAFSFNTLVKTALGADSIDPRSEEHTSELQSQSNLVCRLLLEKKNKS